VSLTGVPIAAAVAMFKYRLYEIDLIINRTLVYATLTAMLVLLYVGGVVSLQYAFRVSPGRSLSWPSWLPRWQKPPCSTLCAAGCRAS